MRFTNALNLFLSTSLQPQSEQLLLKEIVSLFQDLVPNHFWCHFRELIFQKIKLDIGAIKKKKKNRKHEGGGVTYSQDI